jgi:predicted nucleic acid-binding protein
MRLSCLTDPVVQVVADASTAINLVATGCAAAILTALPNPAVITKVVMSELEEGRSAGRRDAAVIAELAAASLISIVPLSEAQELHFESLVIGRGADTLDDGEAATIAYAVEGGAAALIDERKAIRICAERYSAIRLGCTVDLFAHAAVQAALGRDGVAEAVFAALQRARMRVLPRHMDWVVGLIGQERAAVCPSLPRGVRNAGKTVARASG